MIKIKKGEEYNWFSPNTVHQLLHSVGHYVGQSKLNEKHVIGCLIFNDIPLLNNEKTSVYIEFEADIIRDGKLVAVDAGINDCVLFEKTQTPDYVLDRYNCIKTNTSLQAGDNTTLTPAPQQKAQIVNRK